MGAWIETIGIPSPTWGLNQEAPALPDPWTSEVPGFYYIDKSAPSGSSDSNVYGRPGKARLTIPKTIPAGSVVVIHGNYNYSHSSPNQITANGTIDRPVFIIPADNTTVIMRQLQIKGSYFILDGLTWALTASSDSKPPCFKTISPSSFGILRNSNLGGNLTGGGIQITSSNNILVYNNLIHDSGDINSTTDEDIHSINIGGSYNVWIINNEMTRSSGSGTQINAGSLAAQPNTHHIYLGSNYVHETRQSGLFVKQAVDVIISSNRIHDIINTSWSPSKGLGFQYAPERVWYLFNEVYNCTFGIYSGSDSGMGSGRYTYFIGNVIHDIHTLSTSYNGNSAWSQAGIMLAGGIERFIVNNTIDKVDGGIYCPNNTGHMTMFNNIITNVTQASGSSIFIEMGNTAGASEMDYCLFSPDARIKWGNNTPINLNQFKSQYAPKGTNCVSANPDYNVDYSLKDGSEGINEGTLAEVYETFQTLYGLDIKYDISAKPRPVEAWDIGAYEFQGSGGPVPPDPCADIKAENEALKAQVDELTTENANLTRKINEAIAVLSET